MNTIATSINSPSMKHIRVIPNHNDFDSEVEIDVVQGRLILSKNIDWSNSTGSILTGQTLTTIHTSVMVISLTDRVVVGDEIWEPFLNRSETVTKENVDLYNQYIIDRDIRSYQIGKIIVEPVFIPKNILELVAENKIQHNADVLVEVKFVDKLVVPEINSSGRLYGNYLVLREDSKAVVIVPEEKMYTTTELRQEMERLLNIFADRCNTCFGRDNGSMTVWFSHERKNIRTEFLKGLKK